MTFEELRRLARQTNWEKSRLLFSLLRKTLEIINEDDYVNGYVKHLFNDENNELEIYMLTAKDKFVTAAYLHAQKTIHITIKDIADIESIELTENENGVVNLNVTFNTGFTVQMNSQENYDCEHKSYIADFARSLCNL